MGHKSRGLREAQEQRTRNRAKFVLELRRSGKKFHEIGVVIGGLTAQSARMIYLDALLFEREDEMAIQRVIDLLEGRGFKIIPPN